MAGGIPPGQSAPRASTIRPGDPVVCDECRSVVCTNKSPGYTRDGNFVYCVKCMARLGKQGDNWTICFAWPPPVPAAFDESPEPLPESPGDRGPNPDPMDEPGFASRAMNKKQPLCEVCRRPFVRRMPNQKICISDACKTEYQRQQKKKWKAKEKAARELRERQTVDKPIRDDAD